MNKYIMKTIFKKYKANLFPYIFWVFLEQSTYFLKYVISDIADTKSQNILDRFYLKTCAPCFTTPLSYCIPEN